MSTTSPLNLFALPDGQIVNLAPHCDSPAEKFQLADGSFVVAIRIERETEDTGAKDRALVLARAVHAARR